MSFPGAAVAETPRALWVELTSRCPLDCVFCSRKLRRGAGQHMPWEIYRALVDSLVDPRTLALNYSGESLFYPRLLEAIALARSRGAFVELVSAFGAAPPETARALALSGIGRLSASVHAADPARYREIYGRGSSVDLAARVREFQQSARTAPVAPSLDFSFVAMDRNLDQLEPVAALAAELGVSDITVFPVLRRDDIPERFETELDGARAHRPEFRARLESAVTAARERHPGVRITLGNPVLEAGSACLGEVPGPYPGPLPEGARIHTCEQNPWETAHVLSDGDVVACEVLDRSAMGNLVRKHARRDLARAALPGFPAALPRGRGAGMPHLPVEERLPAGPAGERDPGARRARSAQLLRGWHEHLRRGVGVEHPAGGGGVLAPRAGSRTVHVSGVLPPGFPGEPNRLDIACNGVPSRRGGQPLGGSDPIRARFRCARGRRRAVAVGVPHAARLSAQGARAGDGRARPRLRHDAGGLETRRATGRWKPAGRPPLLPLARAVARADRWGARLRRCPSCAGGRAGRPAATAFPW